METTFERWHYEYCLDTATFVETMTMHPRCERKIEPWMKFLMIWNEIPNERLPKVMTDDDVDHSVVVVVVVSRGANHLVR